MRRSTFPQLATVAMAMCGFAVMPACGGGSSDATSGPVSAPAVLAADQATAERLLAAAVAEFEAAEPVMAKCLADHGIHYTSRTLALGLRDPSLGIPDWFTERRTRGYGVSLELDYNIASAVQGGDVAAGEEAQFTELVASGGDCTFVDPQEMINHVIDQAHAGQPQQVVPEDQMPAVIGAWATCMHGRGYEYAQPDEIFVELDDEYRALLTEISNDDDPRLADFVQHELSIANDDLDCLDTAMKE